MALKESTLAELRRIVGAENVLTARVELISYSYDAVPEEAPPEAVVRPVTTEEVVAIIRLANEERFAVYRRGAGTGLAGGSVPLRGGVALDLTRMNRLLGIHRADLYAEVEPGMVNADFAAAVAKEGLLYPPDPASQAASTLGGNVATNAGGLRGLKYGVTRNYVLGMEAVSGAGEVFTTGARTVKSVAGYNLTGLLVGSEGTLAVLTSLRLRLVPAPARESSMQAVFAEASRAAATVAAIVDAGIIPSTLEYLDNFVINTVEDFRPGGLPRDAAAVLLIQGDGPAGAVEEESRRVEEICRANGAAEVRVARTAEETERVWAARRSAIPSMARVRPTLLLQDVTVPRSRFAELIAEVTRLAQKNGVTVGNLGHAGDGNLHPTFLFDEADAEEAARVERSIEEMCAATLKMGGTLSGEHGIGFKKSRFLPQEVPPAALELMRRIKRDFDPQGILNPGKIFIPEKT